MTLHGHVSRLSSSRSVYSIPRRESRLEGRFSSHNGPPHCVRLFYVDHVHRLAPIPQATLTPVAQAEEEVAAEAALEDEISSIVDVAVRRDGFLAW